MKIGDLAEKTGCKVVTIRYYEKEGLLTKPERTEENYRMYGKDDLERLEFVMHCRRLGMKLAEIRKLLDFRDHPLRDCSWVTKLIETHIKGVNEQIASLEHVKKHLEQLRHRCAGGYNGENCGIMHSLEVSAASCMFCAGMLKITSKLLK
ncbi:MAG: Cd(II)/Pb(II)-responsive transcriptional regulator [Desulfovibrionaceae bacterium]|nr:Cd(II)/Pb(II)-responsive transcriptional regulator [Desulfovibrionaceae bacterium]